MLGAGPCPATVSRSRRRDGGDSRMAEASVRRRGVGCPEPDQTRVDTPCIRRVEQNGGVAPKSPDLPPAGNPETMGRDFRIPASDAHDCT